MTRVHSGSSGVDEAARQRDSVMDSCRRERVRTGWSALWQRRSVRARPRRPPSGAAPRCEQEPYVRRASRYLLSPAQAPPVRISPCPCVHPRNPLALVEYLSSSACPARQGIPCGSPTAPRRSFLVSMRHPLRTYARLSSSGESPLEGRLALRLANSNDFSSLDSESCRRQVDASLAYP
jgi:hypothetical protein